MSLRTHLPRRITLAPSAVRTGDSHRVTGWWQSLRARRQAAPRRLALRTHLHRLMLLAIVPALAVAILVGIGATRLAERTRQDRLSDSARALAGAVDQDLEAMVAALANLAMSAGLEEDNDARRVADRARLVADIFASDVLLGRRGATPVSLVHGVPGASASLPEMDAVNAEVLASGQPAISAVFIAPVSQLPVAAVVVPILRRGAVTGTLDMIVSSDRLTAALRHQHQATGVAVLVDRHGRVVAASHDLVRLAGQIHLPPQTRVEPGWRGWLEPPMALTAEAALLRAPGWHIHFTDERPLPTLLSAQPLAESLLAGLATALLSLGVVGYFSDQLTRPVRALTELVRSLAVSSERPPEAMPHSGIAEFEDLRQGMVRADAVLRRRGAAERMALREARTGHELLVSVVNGTAESIYVKDLELRHVLVNRAALLSGPEPRSEWQVLGRSAADLFPAVLARRIDTADRAVLATGQMASFEQEYETADPIAEGGLQRRWLQMTVTPWQDAEGRVLGVVSVSRDITVARRNDARMRAIQADLLRATRLSAMGAMASGLAHELNQPLAAATNYLNAAGRLLERGGRGDEIAFRAACGAVADAAGQTLRAGSIVRRLRQFVERGEVELQPAEVGDLLRDACDLARNDGVTNGLQLLVRVGAEPGLVLVDRTQIQQVLLNLIRNAAEALSGLKEPPDRYGALETAQAGAAASEHAGEIIVSATRAPDGRMWIEVLDNGPGLSTGIAERLFEPFVSSKHAGMGIGLAICRTIIEGHGGRLTAEPNPDAGMAFRITLPGIAVSGEPA